MSDETYKEKFVVFLEGLEMQRIDDFIELPKEDIKTTAIILKCIINNSKTRELLRDLERLDTLFNGNTN
jgi:hypothetical protein